MSNTEVKDVFSATPSSIIQILGQANFGYYIPAYQREYSWDKDKVSRLFEDSGLGLTHLAEKNDAITFLGTLIVIHDNEYRTVEPHIQGDLPGRVELVIDGQQRLSTITIITTVIHRMIRSKQKFYEKKGKENSAFMWVYYQIKNLTNALESSFINDMNYSIDGDDSYAFYPKIIRAYEDSWSRSKRKANYSSPLAEYLFSYIKYLKNNDESTKFSYASDNDSERYSIIPTNISIIEKCIKEIAKGGEGNIEFPSLFDVVRSRPLQQTLFNSFLGDDVIAVLTSEEPTKNEIQFKADFRIILFAWFFLKRLAVTVVTARNEDYAFDMFESLNTTGEPLTAFETFRPLVIQEEGLKNYEESISKSHLGIIEDYLNKFQKAEQKQRETGNLLIPFRLAETGEKLSTKLNHQRKFLRDSYKQLKSIELKRDFVESFGHAASFLKHVWPTDKKQEPRINDDIPINDEKIKVCIALLRQSNHKITIGLLIRFYSNIIHSPKQEISNAINSFYEAVSAITAFYVLYRSSRRSTGGIDNYYRLLMEKGVELPNGKTIKPFARQKSTSVPQTSDLREAFLYILSEKGDIPSKEKWAARTANIGIYSNISILAKYILMVAHEDSTPDKRNPGLIQKGRPGIFPSISIEDWRKLTIEHIAPQTFEGGWDSKLYEDNDIPDCLGNLTLIPQVENSSISNSPWSKKRVFYKALAATTFEEQRRLLKETKVHFSESSIAILTNSKYQQYVKPISIVEQEWDYDLVKRRSLNIASIAYEAIIKNLQ